MLLTNDVHFHGHKNRSGTCRSWQEKCVNSNGCRWTDRRTAFQLYLIRSNEVLASIERSRFLCTLTHIEAARLKQNCRIWTTECIVYWTVNWVMDNWFVQPIIKNWITLGACDTYITSLLFIFHQCLNICMFLATHISLSWTTILVIVGDDQEVCIACKVKSPKN